LNIRSAAFLHSSIEAYFNHNTLSSIWNLPNPI